MARVTVSRWGNSTAIRLPSSVTQRLQLQPGDVVDLTIEEGKATLEKLNAHLAPTLATLVAQMDAEGWKNEPQTCEWGEDLGAERLPGHG